MPAHLSGTDRRVRLALLGCALAMGPTALGCAPRNKAYLGPAQPADQVGVISPMIEQGWQTKYVAILMINEQESIDQWRGGGWSEAHVLPGDHRFRVEFKQMTQATTIPLVDLITIINDATLAAEHDETDIAFPVKPGVVYRIHYKENGHVFAVSSVAAGTMKQPMKLDPPPDAVECVAPVERGQDFWCALLPPVE